MSDREIKVTDKRMFTPDGELREDFRHLETPRQQAPDAGDPAAADAGRRDEGGERAASTAVPETAEREPAAEPSADAGPTLEIPGTPPGLGAPSFVDLVHVLAEPIAIYLGDVELPDGGSAENLEMARVHIDLLDVLRQRTAGNLSSQEAGYLEELLYQFRMRYVQKRG